MKNTILARRYAKALFSLGKQEGKGEEYSEKLSAIAELFHDEAAGVRDALANPLYPLDMRQQVMVKIAENVQADAMLSGFLTLVVDKNRAAILPDIADELRIMSDKDRNISHGVVTSAVALNESLLAKVQATLEKLTGTKVLLETRVDPAIIGGIVAKVGDLVLKMLAEVCQSALRDIDILARMGGEEFAVLLPETESSLAIEVARRLQDFINKASLPLEGNIVIKIQVSIGVASMTSPHDNMDILLHRADTALYEAKNTGRNRICVAPC